METLVTLKGEKIEDIYNEYLNDKNNIIKICEKIGYPYKINKNNIFNVEIDYIDTIFNIIFDTNYNIEEININGLLSEKSVFFSDNKYKLERYIDFKNFIEEKFNV